MKLHNTYRLIIIACLALGWVGIATARPIEFSELSLLVRANESESAISRDVARRKLMYPLTPQQENRLKAEGASDSLMRSLHNPNLAVSKEQAEALEAEREKKAAAVEAASAGRSQQGKLFVFDVALGHPVNLSQWGGYDYELAFYSYRHAGEDIIQPVMIDNVRTVSVVSRNFPIAGLSEDEAFSRDHNRQQRFTRNDADGHRFTPYDARRDLKDDRFNFSDTVAVSSQSASRPLAIDWHNPARIDGVPYALYPVYGAGGVSLYYIGSSGGSVKLAVSTTR